MWGASVSCDGRFLDEGETPPSACSPDQIDRLVQILGRYLDPLGQTDRWARVIRALALTYEQDFLLALIPMLATRLAEQPDLHPNWVNRPLKRWAREGIPQEALEASAGRVVKSTVAAAEPRAASPKPQTEHQRKMAACRELAYGPKPRKEAERG